MEFGVSARFLSTVATHERQPHRVITFSLGHKNYFIDRLIVSHESTPICNIFLIATFNNCIQFALFH
jgi:hypothetical protein